MAVRQIVDIVGALVAQLGFTITITNNVDNGGGNHVLSMDNTYYLTKLKVVIIGGLEYTIGEEDTDFIFNKAITVSPVGHTTPITADTFDLPAPLYFHGTVNSTEKEVLLEMEAKPDSYPIVYLFEHIKENFILDKTQQLERESPIQLFFLDISNYADNLNASFLQDVLKPLSNIETKWFELLRKERGIGQLTGTYDRMNLPRFARFNSNGETELVFEEELTALEIDITLPIKKC